MRNLLSGPRSPLAFLSRHPFAFLLVINLLVWQGVALLMLHRATVPAVYDEYTRAVIAAAWSQHPFIWPADAQWLPLSFWLTGAWGWLVAPSRHVFWYLPFSALQLGLAATFAGWTGILLAGEGERSAPRVLPGELAFAVIVPLLIRDAWRISAGALAEPAYLMLLAASVMLATMNVQRRPDRRGTWVGLAAVLAAFELTRYEAWPLAAVCWTLAWGLGRPRGKSVRTFIAGMIFGWAVVALVPLAWMFVNLAVHGDSLHFMSVTQQYISDNRLLQSINPLLIPFFIPDWIREQSLVLPFLAIAGLFIGRRRPTLLVIATLTVAAWGLIAWLAYRAEFGTVTPSRQVVAGCWTCIPAAILALSAAWRNGPAIRAALLVGLACLIAFGLPVWYHMDWGGAVMDKQTRATFDGLGRLARSEGYRIVVDEAEDYVFLNQLRFFCGTDNVEPGAPNPASPSAPRLVFLKPSPDAESEVTTSTSVVTHVLGRPVEYCPPAAVPPFETSERTSRHVR